MWQAAAILLPVVLPMLAGCRAEQAPEIALTAAAAGVYGIAAHTVAADAHVKAARPYTRTAGQVYLDAATKEHEIVLRETKVVGAKLDESVGAVRALGEKIDKLENKWYTAAGQAVETLVRWSMIISAIGGVLALLWWFLRRRK